MTAYMNRNQIRFAVRLPVRMQDEGYGSQSGLLIEISTQGCRISNIDTALFDAGVPVSVRIGGLANIEAHVRHAQGGIVALRFARPLTFGVLRDMIASYREKPSAFEPMLCYAG